MRGPGGVLHGFWRRDVFTLTMIGCVLFVVLTVLAMLFYAGGTLIDPTTTGYSFTTNFLSELGITTTRAGRANTVSAVLWFTALTMAGVGLMLFSLAFRRFFVRSRWGRTLSTIGSLLGLIAGIGFVGVALAPANVRLQAHMAWLMVAFVAFPFAVVCYAVAILREPSYPNRYGYVFAKEQLFRPLDDVNPLPELAELEDRLLHDCNELGIGPMGFGGKTTVSSVKIEAYHRLPACYFVSIAYMCWACRRAQMIVKNGEVTYK